MSNSSSIQVTDITVGDDEAVDSLLMENQDNLTGRDGHHVVQFNPSLSSQSLQMPHIVPSSHIYSSATPNSHMSSSAASQYHQSLVYVSNGGMQQSMGQGRQTNSNYVMTKNPNTENALILCCNQTFNKESFEMHLNTDHQSADVQMKLMEGKPIDSEQLMQIVIPNGETQKNITFPNESSTSNHQSGYIDSNIIQYQNDTNRNQQQLSAKFSPGSIYSSKSMSSTMPSILKTGNKSMSHDEHTVVTNKGTYVVSSTDMNQLQRSGGQLILQQQPQQQSISLQQIKLSHEQMNEAEAPSVVQFNYQTKDPIKSEQITQFNQNMIFEDNSLPKNSNQQVNEKPNDSFIMGVTDRPYKCDQCVASFLNEAECEEHKRKHSDDGPFTCVDCHFSFMYKSHFRSHKTRCEKKRANRPQQNKPVEVNVVKRSFPTHNSISQQTSRNDQNKRQKTNITDSKIGMIVPPDRIFVSSPYNYSTSKPSVTFHGKSHGRSAGKRTVNPINLKATNIEDFERFDPTKPTFKRLKKQNNRTRPHECQDCDASFTSAEDLENHKSKHSSDGPYRCDGCQFLYLYRKLYDAHKRKCKKGKSKDDGPVNCRDKQSIVYMNDPLDITPADQHEHQQLSAQEQQAVNDHIVSSITPNQGNQQVIYLDKNNQAFSHTSSSNNIQHIDLSSLNSNLNLVLAPQVSGHSDMHSQQQQIQIISPSGAVQVIDANQLMSVGQAGANLEGVVRNNDIKYELIQTAPSVMDGRHVMSLIKKNE